MKPYMLVFTLCLPVPVLMYSPSLSLSYFIWCLIISLYFLSDNCWYIPSVLLSGSQYSVSSIKNALLPVWSSLEYAEEYYK